MAATPKETAAKKEPVELLRAEGLTKVFPTGRKGQAVHAVSGVDLTIRRGETLALVGESGCGKSTLGRTLIKMLPATAGRVFFHGQDIAAMKEKEFRPLRRRLQMVFQDPYASLDPRMTVRDIIAEPLVTYRVCPSRQATTERVLELMQAVGIPAEFLYRYPHQFSGGQRQRIGIARAIALQPELVVCDEPVSALDVSIQAQVVNMFEDLQEKLGVAYLFIAHDLLVVHHISDRIAVMYLGKMMELADSDELNDNPIHPYTQSLLSAVPIPDPKTARQAQRIVLEGDVPSPLHMPSGCPFRTRCRYATEQCAKEMPPFTDRGNGHYVACWNK